MSIIHPFFIYSSEATQKERDENDQPELVLPQALYYGRNEMQWGTQD